MTAPGTLVLVRDGKRLAPAVVLADRGKKLDLVTGPGKPRAVPAGRVVVGVAGGGPTAADAASRWLAERVAELDAAREALTLELAWELAVEDGEALGLDELHELIVDAPTELTRAALLLALDVDGLYFRQKGDAYLPRPQSEVEAAKAGAATRAAREQARTDFVAHVAAVRGSGAEPDLARLRADEASARHLDDLLELALGREESVEAGRAASLLKEIPGLPPTPEGAFRALVALGALGEDEDLLLRGAGIRLSAPSAARAEAEALPEVHALEDRTDLRALHTVAVDEPWTDDPDDALSFEVVEGGVRVWIHITAASELIPADGAIDRAAFDQGASLYRPDGRLSMLPPVAEQRLALLAGVDRASLSLAVTLTHDGEVKDLEPVRALIRVDRQWTYDEVDAALADGDARWVALRDALDAVRGRREADGAVAFSLPEVKVVLEDGAIRLRQVATATPARQLVAELMILAGARWADVAVRAGLPVVYRRQDPPSEPLPERGDFPLLHAWFFAARRFLPKGRLSTEAGPHAGLGLSAYVQVTSPLRRYQDLITQRQLVAQLRGAEPPSDAEAVLRAAGAADAAARDAQRLERERIAHWLCRWCEARLGTTLGATVLGALPHGNRYAALLDEVLLERPIRCDRELAPGARVTVKLVGVNVFHRQFHLELVSVEEDQAD